MSFDEFARLADRVVDEIPPRLCRDLNGGFVALPGEKRDGELLVLGEYVWSGLLGRHVVLYYGSFAALLGDSPAGYGSGSCGGRCGMSCATIWNRWPGWTILPERTRNFWPGFTGNVLQEKGKGEKGPSADRDGYVKNTKEAG